MIKLKYIKYLSTYKIINILRLLFVFYKLKLTKVKIKKLPPVSFISFEPTNYCNLNCFACPTGTQSNTRKKGMADLSLYKQLINENKNNLINIILHFQGEPLLHKQLGEMISYAKINKIYTEFSTNAQLLSDNIEMIINSKPDKIIISLDGLTQDTYSIYRVNGDITKVYSALDNLSKINKKYRPFIELQFLAFKHNEHEIKNIYKLKKLYKIDKISIKTAQIYDKEQISCLPDNNKYSRYNIKSGEMILKKEIKNYCKRIIFGAVITWDGLVLPCCFDKDAKYSVGNINTTPFNKLRNNSMFINFINIVFFNRKQIDICNNCSE